MAYPITPLYACILGIVEGLTEYLPVSSTGHLILTAHLLGLDDPSLSPAAQQGVKAYEIVIQAGALMAVVGLYFRQVLRMVAGVLGRDAGGQRLLVQLIVAFLPAAITGALLGSTIKRHLFGTGPVIAALAVGGVLMIAVEAWRLRRLRRETVSGMAVAENRVVSLFGTLTLEQMTWRAALLIGIAQCVAMWPGTSRSMMTIVAALCLGFTPVAAAEFSFLLALPTLGAATAHDLLKEGHALMLASGPLGLAIGFGVSCVVAWLAVKGFVRFLNRRGLTPFGVYRLGLAAITAWLMLW
jgi:undecaprenyl-diphosphatase